MDFTQAEQDIVEIKHQDLWNGGYVKKFDFSKANSSEAHRIHAVTMIANVCRGDKGVKDREVLYKKLLTEHNGKPGEVFQFVPVMYPTTLGEQTRQFGSFVKFGNDANDKGMLTNLRALLADGDGQHTIYGKSLYNNSTRLVMSKGFHVFKIKIPMMIAAHFLKHGELSFMQVSERTNKLRKYYYCEDLLPIKQSTCFTGNEEEWNNVCYNFSQHTFDLYRKKFRIRQELTNKGSHGLSYTTMWVAGWEQDQYGWDNFFGVRRKKPSQLETRQVADVIYKMMHE